QSYGEFIEQLQFARQEALVNARGGGRKQAAARVVLDDQKSKQALSWVTLATLGVLLIGLIIGAFMVVKGLRGGNETTDNTPTPAVAASIDGFGPGWKEARAKLFATEFNGAERAFGLLAEKYPEDSTERAWAQ